MFFDFSFIDAEATTIGKIEKKLIQIGKEIFD